MSLYAIIASILLWIASLIGVGYWQNGTGHTAERAIWQGKQNQELASANAAILEGEQRARESERLHAEKIAAVSSQYQEKLKNEQQKTADLVAASRAGALRLRDPGATAQAGASGVPETTAGASRCDGPATGQLSGAAAEFLLDFVGRCDAVANQLAAAQQIIRADRE